MSNNQQDVLDHFDELAEEYEDFTEGIPNYREMMGVIREVFDQWERTGSLDRVLELGTGTGKLARAVVDSYQPDFFRGLDGSDNMVTETRNRFDGYDGSAELDFERVEFSQWTPEESYDLVYSSLAVHHLKNPAKRNLFATIYKALKPGGHFLLCDVFRRRSGLIDFYKTIKHHRLLEKGLSEDEAEEHWESHVPNRTLADWEKLFEVLEEIGFSAVDCVWRDMYRSIFVADRR